MVCKRQEQCKLGKMCGWAKDEGTLLTECVEFIERVPLTNEEWLKSLDTEQLADKLTDFSFWLVPTIPTEDKREQIRKKIELWLKEIHK